MNHKVPKTASLRNCTVSIIGDSYSTFEGWIPQGQACYYPKPAKVEDVLLVEHTWWYQLLKRRNMQLVVNDSYSGSTVCTDVREDLPADSSFIHRMKNTMSGTSSHIKPDCIFIFGCTNDTWLSRTVGEIQYDHWTKEDLAKILPAYCCLLNYITQNNPQAICISIINDLITEQIRQGLLTAGKHYGVMSIELQDIQKMSRHPSNIGMQQIAEQVNTALDSYLMDLESRTV